MFGRAQPNKFTLQHLRQLNDTLQKHQTVTDGNREILVEALREIAELMIWGDQHEPSFFDFFVEKRILAHFSRILSQKFNRKGQIAVQLLQTLSILIQNTRAETSLYYLFSNNYINDLITLQEFDARDEEVLAYYISFLKTISLKLNKDTVQFFFKGDGGGSFPLFNEAIRFCSHRESMVRAAVRTLTLNIYSIPDKPLQEYLLLSEPSKYLVTVVDMARNECCDLNARLEEAAGTNELRLIAGATNELTDQLCYLTDLLGIGLPELSERLAGLLWERLVEPVVLAPLMLGSGLPSDGPKAAVSIRASLYCSSRILSIFSHRHFVSMVAETLLALPAPPPPPPPQQTAGKKDKKGKKGEQKAAPEPPPPSASSSSYRSSLLGCLGALDQGLSCGVASVLLAACGNKNIDEEVLEGAGVLSARRSKRRALIQALTDNGEGTAEELENGPEETLQELANKLRSTRLGAASSSSSSPSAALASAGCATSRAARGEIVDALLRTLADDRPSAPIPVVQYFAKLLKELLVGAQGEAAELTAEQRALLHGAVDAAGAALALELEGPWCDAIPALCRVQWKWGARAVEAAPMGDEAVALAVGSRRPPADAAGDAASSSSGLPPLPGQAPSQTAPFAERALGAVRSWAAAQCLQRALLGLPLDEPPAPRPLPDDYATFREEVKEGLILPLPDSDRGLPCRVAFERGKERSVYLSIAVAALDASGTATATLLLTEPNPVALGNGIVRAVAPVAGATPYADKSHGKWLHVRVRSSLNALLGEVTTVAPAPPPGAPLAAVGGPGLLSSARRLQDGHWTLSFPDEDSCQVALALVKAHALRLQDVCEELLGPLGVVAPERAKDGRRKQEER